MDHIYTLEGSRIVSEEYGDNLLIFLYDESGAPIGMQYRNIAYAKDRFDTFYYEKNLFGDIIALYNESGTKVLSYTYDAWGNHTTTWHNSSGTNMYAQYNPFRYRGYYYDTDTGLYYLQSRYYNPQWGRFLNADAYINANGDMIGFNMYAYCSNNPVMGYDPTGYEDVCVEDFSNDDNPLNDMGPMKGGKGSGDSLKPGTYRAVRGVKLRGKVVRTGQNHHAISKTINDAKVMNNNLDCISRNDPAFQIKALTPEAHKGYQDWHRTYDKEISEWLKRNQDATPQGFINQLNNYYNNYLFNRFGPVHFCIKE